MKKVFLSIVSIFTVFSHVVADEGMWLLKELNRQSVARMQELGFSFPLDSVYNEQNPSLKDAVVIFGGGCTGVAVSAQGLIFTNHHCGYDDIQKLSSVEHDYLKNGFVSQSVAEELPCKGLEVRFLKQTRDVTSLVLEQVSERDDESARSAKISKAIESILQPYADAEFLDAKVQPFYSQNKYYLVVYEVFPDVRLVLTPPSSIGKFGGETDNWMWPRHTGDFAVFRVYAGANNQPAHYSESNSPYRPKYIVPVSLQGYDNADYAMTIGYPGSTQRYLSSWGVQNRIEAQNKPRIEVREAKQNIWREAMQADDAVRIKYASKYARSSNYWKNSMGMNEALERLGVIEQKRELEAEFEKYLQGNKKARNTYGEALPLMKEGFLQLDQIGGTFMYFYEVFRGIEIFQIAKQVRDACLVNNAEKTIEELPQRVKDLYKDYQPELDQKVATVLLKLYAERVPEEYLPTFYTQIKNEFGGDYQQYTQWLFSHSAFVSLDKVSEAMKNSANDSLWSDPVLMAEESISAQSVTLFEQISSLRKKIAKGERLFVGGLMEMNGDTALSPDANFTQRLSYGSIGGYRPADGVSYSFHTTSKGVLEKVDNNDPEFMLQDYIVEALLAEDFGEYASKDGQLYTCFISNNDITGGNSGSPVFNGKAELIGLAFDGNWEALSGDIVFEKNLQRSINVDIRYVLYVIDKIMKAPRLIDELQLR